MSKFTGLIEELGTVLGVPLQAEQDLMCTLRIKDKVRVQLEYDPEQDLVILLCFVCEIPPGTFREEVLAAGLKSNFVDTSSGVFAYSDKNGMLMLQTSVPPSAGASFLATVIERFASKGIEWKEAVENGRTADLVPRGGGSSLPSPMSFS